MFYAGFVRTGLLAFVGTSKPSDALLTEMISAEEMIHIFCRFVLAMCVCVTSL